MIVADTPIRFQYQSGGSRDGGTVWADSVPGPTIRFDVGEHQVVEAPAGIIARLELGASVRSPPAGSSCASSAVTTTWMMGRVRSQPSVSGAIPRATTCRCRWSLVAGCWSCAQCGRPTAPRARLRGPAPRDHVARPLRVDAPTDIGGTDTRTGTGAIPGQTGGFEARSTHGSRSYARSGGRHRPVVALDVPGLSVVAISGSGRVRTRRTQAASTRRTAPATRSTYRSASSSRTPSPRERTTRTLPTRRPSVVSTVRVRPSTEIWSPGLGTPPIR